VNKYGPCIPVTGAPEKISVPSAAEFLLQDQLRVKSFQVRLSMNPNSGVFKEMQTTIPASIVPSGGAYVVTAGLGTPKKDFPSYLILVVTLHGLNASRAWGVVFRKINRSSIQPHQLHTKTFRVPRNFAS